MLRFFRKIRQNLLENGKIRTYFWYAIGEVFLVVIGILIALQINNWNEERIEETFEISMLKELVVALEGDSAIITLFLEPRIERKEAAVDSFFVLVTGNYIVDEEGFYDLYEDMNTEFEYRYNIGPYETIKSKGLDVISNDSLRSEITALYERVLPAYEVFIDKAREDKLALEQALEKDFLKQELMWHHDEWHIHPVPSVNDIYQHQSFIQVLDIEHSISNNSRRRIDSIKSLTAYLRKAIRAELRERES